MNVPPAIYKIVKVDDVYQLEPYLDVFQMPSKYYGKLDVMASRFWNTFGMVKSSLGAIFTGNSGSGKTTIAELISNYGISNRMPAILVTEINADIELVKFIDSLDRCVIVFDEFVKNFGQLQDKMLTMLNDLGSRKKFYIITENDKNVLSKYILNRPGRLLYHIDFSRMKLDVLEEYCRDYNIDFNSEFYKSMIKVYNRSIEFSIDHLKALVSEHLRYPNDTFEELVEVLNVDGLVITQRLIPVKVIEVTTDSKGKKVRKQIELDDDTYNIPLTSFKNGRNLWLYPKDGGGSIGVTHEDVIEVYDDRLVCFAKKKYEVYIDLD